MYAVLLQLKKLAANFKITLNLYTVTFNMLEANYMIFTKHRQWYNNY